MEIFNAVVEYLVGIQLHPMVTLVVFIVISLGRQRFEEVEVDPILRRRIGQKVLVAALAVSVIGQLAIYWPRSGQMAAICVFMSLAQMGVASFAYTYAEKWGVMERVGRMVQKKMDDKGAVDASNPPTV